MATLPATAGHPTLVNWAKFLDPNGTAYDVAELLNQSNEFLSYMTWIEGNLATGHKAAVRVGLPTTSLRRFYRGATVSKSDRAIIEDVCAMREGRNEIDKDLAELENNQDQFRMDEGISYVESMTQSCAQDLIYADASLNKDGITGLAPRYATVNTATANTANNVIDAGGTGSNNTSVYLVGWGSRAVTGIFPKGSKAGLQHFNLGELDAYDANRLPFRAYADRWVWKYGLHVKDWRCVVRICNINVADLVSQANTQATTASTLLMKLMIKAFAKVPSSSGASYTFLANRTVKEMLSIQALDKSQNAVAFGPAVDQFGKVGPGSVAGTGTGITGGQLMFQGTPVLTVDRLLSTEARVV